MDVWGEIIGQDQAVAVLRHAALPPESGNRSGMTHAWLISGPPGSGRSNIAYAFATALLSDGENDHRTTVQVKASSHPDLSVLRTEKVIISIDEVRRLVTASQFSPSHSRYRVIVIEDADRMTERTSNLLLKSLEEPPVSTVWILCAPSEADLLPTIRSRVRSVRLRVPSVDNVAELLHRRDSVDRELARQSARHAQSHIGMARRLATDETARQRRFEVISEVLQITSSYLAVKAANKILESATLDGEQLAELRAADERRDLLRSLGVAEGQPIPPALRAQVRVLDEDSKRRATRALRDGIDRILVDVMSLFRDISRLQLGVKADLINAELSEQLTEVAARMSQTQTLDVLDRIALTRRRIGSNVAPALALEALLIAAIRKK